MTEKHTHPHTHTQNIFCSK